MPIINNEYPLEQGDVAYAPSDMDSRNNMSRKDINALIDSLCKTRMENQDVVLLDSIQQQKPYDPVRQEAYELEQDRIAIEDDILKSIFESSTPMTIEERNEYIANGMYDKYQQMIARRQMKTPAQIAKEDNEAMYDIEAEIKARQATPSPEELEQVTEVISEEVTENDNFPADEIVEEDTVASEDTISDETTTDTKLDAEQVIDIFETGREPEPEKKKPNLNKALAFPNMIAGLANPVVEDDRSITDIAEELKDTMQNITSGKAIVDAIKDNEPEEDDDDYTPMTMEEFNDVPATEISVPDDILTSSLMEQYHEVSYQDAVKLIDVMNRYKAHEKFKVFEALPNSIKNAILREAADAGGVNKATLEFFAKTFINDLVNNTFMDKEIKDFNAELQEALAPMGNIVGTMMDQYNDEVYDKFTTQLRAKAKEIEEEDPGKATQLIVIAKNFEESINMNRLIDYITAHQSAINSTYKTARDNWNKQVAEYDNAISTVSPKPRDLESCLKGMRDAGYPEDYAKTVVLLAKGEIMDAIKEGSLEEHIYAYYLSNALYNLSFTTNNSLVVTNIKKGLDMLMDLIDEKMAPLKARRTKKDRRRNRRKRK